jgi:hypothetical protein
MIVKRTLRNTYRKLNNITDKTESTGPINVLCSCAFLWLN